MITLTDCQATILHEIKQPESRPRDIAQTYGLILRSPECQRVNWRTINQAIIARWDVPTLVSIKRDAQRFASSPAAPACGNRPELSAGADS